eukprot:COSAG06_NODE_6361_length_2965_cov_136.446615_3_plen_169_part_00
MRGRQPAAAQGYYSTEDSFGSRANMTVVTECVPYRACLGKCSEADQEMILTELGEGTEGNSLDEDAKDVCPGGTGAALCSRGYEGMRCARCTPYSTDTDPCGGEGSSAVAHYRLNERCAPCPCTIWSFRIIIAVVMLLALAMLFALDMFSSDFSDHASSLAAPAFIFL